MDFYYAIQMVVQIEDHSNYRQVKVYNLNIWYNGDQNEELVQYSNHIKMTTQRCFFFFFFLPSSGISPCGWTD